MGFLKFLEDIAKTMNSMGDTAMSSYFKYKFENLQDSVINRTPIIGKIKGFDGIGLAENIAKEDKKVKFYYQAFRRIPN